MSWLVGWFDASRGTKQFGSGGVRVIDWDLLDPRKVRTGVDSDRASEDLVD
jgi:hypothetical protein